MKKKNIIIFISCFTTLFVGYHILKFVNRMGGSHHDAEYYQFQKSKNDLILAVDSFKRLNPDYKVITTQLSGELGESFDGYSYHTYYCRFYLKDKDMVLSCIIRQPLDDKYARIGLFAMSRSTAFRKWYTINTSDLSWKENREIKKAFESEILDKLGHWKRVYWYDNF